MTIERIQKSLETAHEKAPLTAAMQKKLAAGLVAASDQAEYDYYDAFSNEEYDQVLTHVLWLLDTNHGGVSLESDQDGTVHLKIAEDYQTFLNEEATDQTKALQTQVQQALAFLNWHCAQIAAAVRGYRTFLALNEKDYFEASLILLDLDKNYQMQDIEYAFVRAQCFLNYYFNVSDSMEAEEQASTDVVVNTTFNADASASDWSDDGEEDTEDGTEEDAEEDKTTENSKQDTKAQATSFPRSPIFLNSDYVLAEKNNADANAGGKEQENKITFATYPVFDLELGEWDDSFPKSREFLADAATYLEISLLLKQQAEQVSANYQQFLQIKAEEAGAAYYFQVSLAILGFSPNKSVVTVAEIDEKLDEYQIFLKHEFNGQDARESYYIELQYTLSAAEAFLKRHPDKACYGERYQHYQQLLELDGEKVQKVKDIQDAAAGKRKALPSSWDNDNTQSQEEINQAEKFLMSHINFFSAEIEKRKQEKQAHKKFLEETQKIDAAVKSKHALKAGYEQDRKSRLKELCQANAGLVDRANFARHNLLNQRWICIALINGIGIKINNIIDEINALQQQSSQLENEFNINRFVKIEDRVNHPVVNQCYQALTKIRTRLDASSKAVDSAITNKAPVEKVLVEMKLAYEHIQASQQQIATLKQQHVIADATAIVSLTQQEKEDLANCKTQHFDTDMQYRLRKVQHTIQTINEVSALEQALQDEELALNQKLDACFKQWREQASKAVQDYKNKDFFLFANNDRQRTAANFLVMLGKVENRTKLTSLQKIQILLQYIDIEKAYVKSQHEKQLLHRKSSRLYETFQSIQSQLNNLLSTIHLPKQEAGDKFDAINELKEIINSNETVSYFSHQQALEQALLAQKAREKRPASKSKPHEQQKMTIFQQQQDAEGILSEDIRGLIDSNPNGYPALDKTTCLVLYQYSLRVLNLEEYGSPRTYEAFLGLKLTESDSIYQQYLERNGLKQDTKEPVNIAISFLTWYFPRMEVEGHYALYEKVDQTTTEGKLKASLVMLGFTGNEMDLTVADIEKKEKLYKDVLDEEIPAPPAGKHNSKSPPNDPDSQKRICQETLKQSIAHAKQVLGQKQYQEEMVKHRKYLGLSENAILTAEEVEDAAAKQIASVSTESDEHKTASAAALFLLNDLKKESELTALERKIGSNTFLTRLLTYAQAVMIQKSSFAAKKRKLQQNETLNEILIYWKQIHENLIALKKLEQETFTPKNLALLAQFEHCGDENIENRVKKINEVVKEVAQLQIQLQHHRALLEEMISSDALEQARGALNAKALNGKEKAYQEIRGNLSLVLAALFVTDVTKSKAKYTTAERLDLLIEYYQLETGYLNSLAGDNNAVIAAFNTPFQNLQQLRAIITPTSNAVDNKHANDGNSSSVKRVLTFREFVDDEGLLADPNKPAKKNLCHLIN